MKAGIIGVAVVLIVGVGLWMYANTDTQEPLENPSENMGAPEEGVHTSAVSEQAIAAALSGSGSIRCEWHDSEANTEGVALIKDGNIRVESVDENGEVSNAIYGEEYLYAWQEGKVGMKMSRAAMESMQGQAGAQMETRADVEARIQNEQEVRCDEGEISDSAFEEPQGVEFQDMSSMMETAAQMQAQMGGQLEVR